MAGNKAEAVYGRFQARGGSFGGERAAKASSERRAIWDFQIELDPLDVGHTGERSSFGPA